MIIFFTFVEHNVNLCKFNLLYEHNNTLDMVTILTLKKNKLIIN
jgi:hypothetical protein